MSLPPFFYRYPCVACLIACLFCGCARTDTSTATTGQNSVDAGPLQPVVPDYAIWRPFFFTEFGNQAIDDIRGTAFAVKLGPDGKVFLVTALHLLGPTGGLVQQVEPGQIQKLVNEVVIGETFGATDRNFTLKLPVEFPLESYDKDFWLDADVLLLPTEGVKARFSPMELAVDSPKAGDTIWLSTAVFGGAPASQTTHEATVLEAAEDGSLRYKFSNLELKLDAADGAPLVDVAGKIVGMHQLPMVSEAEPVSDAVSSGSTKPGATDAMAAKSPVEGAGISIAKMREIIERLLPQ